MHDELGSYIPLVLSYALPAARVAGVLAFLPVFGAGQVPAQLRLFLAIAIAILVAPGMSPQTPLPHGFEELAIILISEIILGVCVGWAVTALLEAARWAGDIINMQSGLGAADLFDPTSGSGTSTLGQVLYLTSATAFLVMDGHHWVLAALGKSFETLPVGSLAGHTPAAQIAMEVLTTSLGLTFRFAIVTTVALLLADFALTIIGRQVPQMNVFLVGIPAKLALGLIITALSVRGYACSLTILSDAARHFSSALLGGG